MDIAKARHLLQKIEDPDVFVANKLKNMPENVKLAFFSSIFLALLTHGIMFINNFINEDGIIHFRRVDFWRDVGSARWGSGFVDMLTRPVFVTVPWTIGIFAILSLALSVMLVVSILEIRKKLFVVIAAFLIVAFPSVAYQFSYSFYATGYTFSFLFSACAIYFTKKYRHGYALGAFLLMFSLSIYQSYVGFAIGLSMLLIVRLILEENNSVKDILNNAFKYLACGGLGMILYFISVRLSLIISGRDALAAYRGIDNMGQIPLELLPLLVRQSFFDFILFFVPSARVAFGRFFYVSNWLFFLYLLVLLCIVYLLVRLVIIKRLISKTNCMKFALLVVFIAAMPIGLNVIELVTPESHASAHTIHQFVLSLIFVFVLHEAYVSAIAGKNKTGKYSKYYSTKHAQYQVHVLTNKNLWVRVKIIK